MFAVPTKQQHERPPVDPAVVGLIIIAVVIFAFFAARNSHVIAWGAR